MCIDESDRKLLHDAKQILENPGFAARVIGTLGKPIEEGVKRLPEGFSNKVFEITKDALDTALRTALFTMGGSIGQEAPNLAHKFSVALTGGVGGWFGVPGLAIELPISTTIMMRAIATIAREHGEDTSSNEARMACLEVFALGGKSESDDGTETGYYAVRYSMAKLVPEAADFVTKQGLAAASKGDAPILVRLITKVAERFSIQITEKSAAQAIPVVGAAAGAMINIVFIDHFQNMAKGHFVVRKLERKYGQEVVKEKYDSLP